MFLRSIRGPAVLAGRFSSGSVKLTNRVQSNNGLVAPSFHELLSIQQCKKAFTTQSTQKEGEIAELLKAELDTDQVKVTDISGGCGSMYDIEVTSSLFEGKSRLQQQRMVNKILKEEIAQMHGLQLTTKKP